MEHEIGIAGDTESELSESLDDVEVEIKLDRIAERAKLTSEEAKRKEHEQQSKREEEFPQRKLAAMLKRAKHPIKEKEREVEEPKEEQRKEKERKEEERKEESRDEEDLKPITSRSGADQGDRLQRCKEAMEAVRTRAALEKRRLEAKAVTVGDEFAELFEGTKLATRRQALTKEEWGRLHDVLMLCFKSENFQRRLIYLYEESQVVDEDEDEEQVDRLARFREPALNLCLETAKVALKRHGFSESAPNGIIDYYQWFAFAENSGITDKRMRRKFGQMGLLLDPEQTGRRFKLNPMYLQPRKGRLWSVIAGVSTNGIIVRRGQDLKSPELKERLSHGAWVEEIDFVGGRLHYRKLLGDGPHFGWASTVRVPNSEYFMQPWPAELHGWRGKVIADNLHNNVNSDYPGGA